MGNNAEIIFELNSVAFLRIANNLYSYLGAQVQICQFRPHHIILKCELTFERPYLLTQKQN